MPGQAADTGRLPGTTQRDAMQSHEHYIPTYAGIAGMRSSLRDDDGVLSEANFSLSNSGLYYTYDIGPTGNIAIETRPANIAIPLCIYLGLTA